MSTRNAALSGNGRYARFLPGWWILPGLVGSAMAWALAIWLFVH